MNVSRVMGIVLFVIVAGLVLGRVSMQSTLALEETVELLRQSRIVAEASLFRDDLVVPVQVYPFSVLPLLVYGLSSLVGETIALLLLQFASIIVLIAGLDGLLKVLGAADKERWAVVGMLALSPTLIYGVVAVPPVVVALQVVGALLLAKKKGTLGLGLMLLAAFDGMLVALVGCGLVGVFYKRGMATRNVLIFALISQVAVGLFSLVFFLSGGGAISMRGADLGSWVMELGAQGGVSIVVMGLALLGSLVIYKRKYALESLLLIGVLAASFVMASAHIYAGIALAITAGLFLSWLVSYRWELRQLRILSYAAIVLGIIGVVGVSCAQILWGQPDKEHLVALQEMGRILPQDAVVFAPQRWGFPIEVFSKRTVVLNARSPEERVRNLTRSILDEVYLPKLEAVLKREGITHIYLPQEILQTRPIDDPEGGLAYLLQNAETFKNVYDDQGAGVWEYVQSGDRPRTVSGP